MISRHKTIGRSFELDLEKLRDVIEEKYNLGNITNLKLLGKGYVNLNFVFESKGEKYVVRIFGEFDQNTESELKIMQQLAKNGFNTALPLTSTSDNLQETFGEYNFAVFEFLPGRIPGYAVETFERIGRSVAELQELISKTDLDVRNKNRYTIVYKNRRELISLVESNMDLLKKILDEEIYNSLEQQIVLFEEIKFESEELSPIHSDIYNLNILDDGKKIYILDFEYIGLGFPIIDAVSYIGFDGIINDRTEYQFTQGNSEPRLLKPQVKAYINGYKSIRNFPKITDLKSAFLMTNIGDNFYNLEKAIKSGENMFGGYKRSLDSTIVLLEKLNFLNELITQ